MRTSLLRLGLYTMAAVLLAAACDRDYADRRAGSPEDLVPESERFGGTAVLGSILDLQTMNSLVANETYSRLVQLEILFMPLVKYNEALEPRPWLAERWDTTRVAPDTLELTFHLRRDIRWHDDQPTTAEDVKFTYERVLDPAVGSSLASSFAQYSPRAVLVDPYTIRFRLRPHAEFLDGWSQLAIMPKHVLGEVPLDQLSTHSFGSREPVGNGPFRFVRRVPGQEWVFEANPDFPAELGGRPYLDRLVFRVIPDQTTLLTESLTGGVDVYIGVSAEQAAQLDGSPDVVLVSAPSSQWTFIGWNGRLPMFDTPAERRALTMAIDRAGIVNALLHKHAEVGRSTVTPGHWSYDAADPQTTLPYDMDSARRLLAEAGWRDRDGDGILEDEQGLPFRFTLKTPHGNDTRRDITQIVQAQLKQLGIDVRPSVVEGNTLIGQLVGNVNRQGERERDFEAVVMGWVDNLRKDDSNLFHSRNLNNPFQIAGYSNPRADMLLDTLGLIMDRSQARPLWREYQALIAQEVPSTVLYYPYRLAGVHKRVQGVEMDSRGELATITRWWIDPAQRRGGDIQVQ